MLNTLFFLAATFASFQPQVANTAIEVPMDALTFEKNGQIYTIVLDYYEPFIKIVKDNEIIWTGIHKGQGPEELEKPGMGVIQKKDGRFLVMSPGQHLTLEFENEAMTVISREKKFMTLLLSDDLALKTGWKGMHLKRYGFLDYENPERTFLKNKLAPADQGYRSGQSYFILDAHNLGFYEVNMKGRHIRKIDYPMATLEKWTKEKFGKLDAGKAYNYYHKPSGLAGNGDVILISFVRDLEEPQQLFIFKAGKFISRRETPGRITGLFKEGDHYKAHFYDTEAGIFYTETIEF